MDPRRICPPGVDVGRAHAVTYVYPASTHLALASAADALALGATNGTDHERYAAARVRHLRAVDGGDLVDEPTSLPVQIAALELLRSHPPARAEARAAIAALFGAEPLPDAAWIVRPFMIAVVNGVRRTDDPRVRPVRLV